MNKVDAKETIIDECLKHLGFMEHLKGTKYLRQAIHIVLENRDGLLIKQVYSQVALINKTTFARIERNIRHAIQVAYERSELGVYQDYFGQGQQKAPSNAQVIYTIAKKVGM